VSFNLQISKNYIKSYSLTTQKEFLDKMTSEKAIIKTLKRLCKNGNQEEYHSASAVSFNTKNVKINEVNSVLGLYADRGLIKRAYIKDAIGRIYCTGYAINTDRISELEELLKNNLL